MTAPLGVGAKRRTIALVLPTLNELEGLKATLPGIDRSLVDHIIVVDGGSRKTLETEWDDNPGKPRLVIPVSFGVFWPKRAQKSRNGLG